MLWSESWAPELQLSGPRLWSKWVLTALVLASPLSVYAEKSAADYYVRSLPGQPEGPLLKMHAGHIEVDPENNGNLFFWHYQNRHIADRQRTVIWLNGGPGCSSMDGALMEVGPYRLKDENTLVYNEGSWDEFANLLFVDQPVGTGFSYVNTNSYIHQLDEMAAHFVIFLEKWFELFPQYEQDDIYIAGESYAGQHIPYIAKAILERNKKKADTQSGWNVKGLVIGNGWISPVDQYQAYVTYAYQEGLITDGTPAAKQAESRLSKCLKKMNEKGGIKVTVPECEDVLQGILKDTQVDRQCINMYDIRLQDTYPSCGMNWPPDLTSITPYLRRRDVTSALNINPDKKTGWTECSGAVSGNFHANNSTPAVEFLPDLLEAGIPIVLFSGQKDFICNHIGTEEMIKNMKWSGGTGFELSPGVWAPRQDWTFEGEPAGIYQKARNLTYILFYNSSHMVPFDYPRRTRDMLDRFLNIDIGHIGGPAADSRIDGEKAPPTSVAGHPNSTAAAQQEDERVQTAKWDAYYKAGEAALVVVVIAASVWGFFIWRSRRTRQGYQGVYPNDDGGSSGSLPQFGNRRRDNGDLEAADFDESELDRMTPNQAASSSVPHLDERENYSVGEESSDDEDEKSGNHRGANSKEPVRGEEAHISEKGGS
ncbi:hypothetical protein AJ80_08306 [Polytolypa hystricis UAMH7299]|uniref:Carboxypeptidase n=1 Tax=Polytolypa hystricis (strain UAMH7299) TaxID=1447883 RepID=A0A2B7X1V2_POLH7|nr:hypothetical protein AJ80_08306 [Polytolypa hystricis UAMH7299]